MRRIQFNDYELALMKGLLEQHMRHGLHSEYARKDHRKLMKKICFGGN